jgi:hypothetical protein
MEENRIVFVYYTRSFILSNACIWGAVAEEVRTVFEELDDATIYIPDLLLLSN